MGELDQSVKNTDENYKSEQNTSSAVPRYDINDKQNISTEYVEKAMISGSEKDMLLFPKKIQQNEENIEVLS